MTRAEAARILALASQCEMALVRKDRVVGPLLAQAARAADGLAGAQTLALAARLVRDVDITIHEPARKVAQALTRVATQEAQAALLRS
jgi:hypothetical protein